MRRKWTGYVDSTAASHYTASTATDWLMPTLVVGESRPEIIRLPPGVVSVEPIELPTWRCEYCGRTNEMGRVACVGCQAGRPEEPAKIHPSIAAYKGTPVNELQGEGLEEAKAYMRSPDGIREWFRRTFMP